MTAAIAWNATPTQVQTALAALSNVGAGNVSVTGSAGNYLLSFATGMGAPVVAVASSLTGTNPTISAAINQSGAALFIQQLAGLHIFGDGRPRGGNWDNTGVSLTPTSCSNLVWTGTNGGIMMDLHSCNEVTIEHLGFVGAPTQAAAHLVPPLPIARVGIVFSLRPGYGASGLNCIDCSFSYIFLPSSAPATLTACVQFGMNLTDLDCDTSLFQHCYFQGLTGVILSSIISNGIVLVNSQSDGHQLQSVFCSNLTNCFWAQAGGNLQWDMGIIEGGACILRLGTGPGPNSGGGINASTFLLKGLRSETFGAPNPNIVIVDAGYCAGNTSIVIEGFNDDFTASLDPTAAFNLGAGVNLILRDSVIQRTTPTSLATEAGQVLSVAITSGGSGYSASSPPGVTFSAPPAGGTTATGTALVSGITPNVTIANGGSGYGAPPTVTFDPPAGPGGVQATGMAYLDPLNPNGVVKGILVVNPGAGYSSNPVVTFHPALGSPSAHGNLASGQVVGVQITNPGSGYSSAPSVTFGSGSAAATSVISDGVAPTPPTFATLQTQNLITVTPAAAMCQNLTNNTKMDFVNEQWGVIRPDVSTMPGRARYSQLDMAILKLNPKNFWDLGNIGLTAPNRGYNSWNAALQAYNDGQFTGNFTGPPPSMLTIMTQNVQGLVLTDAIGGFNTRKVGGTAGTGWLNLVNLNSSGLGIAPTILSPFSTSPGWSCFGVFLRNVTGGYHPIISNLSATLGNGGFELRLDATYNQFRAIFDDGLLGGSAVRTYLTSAIVPLLNQIIQPVYFMVAIDPALAVNPLIRLYLRDPSTGTAYQDPNTVALPTSFPLYGDGTAPVPVIGATPEHSTIADLQIARIATFDYTVSLAQFQALCDAGNKYGR